MKLFKTYDCAFCGVVQDMLDDKEIEYEVIYKEDSPELAEEYGVMGVPAMFDEEGNRYQGLHECLAKVNTLG